MESCKALVLVGASRRLVAERNKVKCSNEGESRNPGHSDRKLSFARFSGTPE